MFITDACCQILFVYVCVKMFKISKPLSCSLCILSVFLVIYVLCCMFQFLLIVNVFSRARFILCLTLPFFDYPVELQSVWKEPLSNHQKAKFSFGRNLKQKESWSRPEMDRKSKKKDIGKIIVVDMLGRKEMWATLIQETYYNI